MELEILPGQYTIFDYPEYLPEDTKQTKQEDSI